MVDQLNESLVRSPRAGMSPKVRSSGSRSTRPVPACGDEPSFVWETDRLGASGPRVRG